MERDNTTQRRRCGALWAAKRLAALAFLLGQFLVVTATFSASSNSEEHPDKAVCRVCAARSTHGDDPEVEKVAGVSTHEGKHYYFCSDQCKAEFDASPEWWAPLELPFPIPARNVTALDGEVVSLSFGGGEAGKHELTLVDFWATWCAPCKKTMKALQERFERGGDGLRIVGVSIDEGDDALKQVRRYVKRQGAEYPMFLDDQDSSLWAALKVRAVPTMMLVDGQGRVVWRYTGPDGEERLDTFLEGFGNQ